MKKLKYFLYFAIIYIAGFLSGGLVTFKIGTHLLASDPAVGWEHELSRRLELTPAQEQRISPIVMDVSVAFRTQMQANLQAALDRANAKIALEVTPAQKEKLLQFAREQRDFIAAHLGPPPPAGSRPGTPPPP